MFCVRYDTLILLFNKPGCLKHFSLLFSSGIDLKCSYPFVIFKGVNPVEESYSILSRGGESDRRSQNHNPSDRGGGIGGGGGGGGGGAGGGSVGGGEGGGGGSGGGSIGGLDALTYVLMPLDSLGHLLPSPQLSRA